MCSVKTPVTLGLTGVKGHLGSSVLWHPSAFCLSLPLSQRRAEHEDSLLSGISLSFFFPVHFHKMFLDDVFLPQNVSR